MIVFRWKWVLVGRNSQFCVNLVNNDWNWLVVVVFWWKTSACDQKQPVLWFRSKMINIGCKWLYFDKNACWGLWKLEKKSQCQKSGWENSEKWVVALVGGGYRCLRMQALMVRNGRFCVNLVNNNWNWLVVAVFWWKWVLVKRKLNKKYQWMLCLEPILSFLSPNPALHFPFVYIVYMY